MSSNITFTSTMYNMFSNFNPYPNHSVWLSFIVPKHITTVAFFEVFKKCRHVPVLSKSELDLLVCAPLLRGRMGAITQM